MGLMLPDRRADMVMFSCENMNHPRTHSQHAYACEAVILAINEDRKRPHPETHGLNVIFKKVQTQTSASSSRDKHSLLVLKHTEENGAATLTGI